MASSAALLLAACGSTLDPATVAQVNGNGVAISVEGGPQTGSDASGSEVSDGGGATSVGGGAGAPSGDAGSATGGGSTSGGGSQPAGGDAASGENAADGGIRAGSCSGFKNGVGITDSTITIANASDISGPVPGLFESAQKATRAYVNYFNQTNDICGRKLEVLALDSRTDSGGDQQAYTRACESAFAAVGSMSAFDAGGAATAENCGLPDIRSYMVTPDRRDCSTCFSAMGVAPNLVMSALPKYWMRENKEATQNAAILYVDVGASATNSASWREAWTRAGWNVDYFQAHDQAEFNFGPYVQQFKDKGIKLVVYVGPYQHTVKLQQAMQQQGYEPEVFLQDATIYDQDYVEQAGDAGDGSYVYSTTELFDDPGNREMMLYRAWLEQTDPGANPNMYGVYAWSATRLFVEQALRLGGRLGRGSLVAAMRDVKGWDSNGMHAPQQVGAKTTPECLKIFQLQDGSWSQVSPGDYMCGPLIDSGIGG